MNARRTGPETISRAAVLGAGVMGAGIAAHLANAGVACLLLDLKSEGPGSEGRGDVSHGSGGARAAGGAESPSRLAVQGLQRAVAAKPAAFYRADLARLVTPGNFDDDLPALREVDWIIEVVSEDPAIKRDLYSRIAPHIAESTIVSSNTSGLSAEALAYCLPEGVRSRFLVTHFFNPPRYLKLLELVPTAQTDPTVLERMAEFGRRTLGKGVIIAKDTPNFIGNRVGAFAMFHALHLALDEGYSVAEVDKMTGKAIGRPKSATFRTADVVGLDVLVHVARNMYENLPNDPQRRLFRPPDFVETMLERGWLGAKRGQGFYKKVRGTDGTSEILMLDPKSLEYVPQGKVVLPSLEMAKAVEGLAERLRGLVAAPDRAGSFLWKNLSATLRYAGALVPEISDDLVSIDRALRWGFGWEMGPFEIWDALGVERVCARMETDGHEVPPLAQAVRARPKGAFYSTMPDGERAYFDLASSEPVPLPRDPRVFATADLKRAGKVVFDGPDATLLDLGDEVACLEFHTKMNTIGPGLIEAMERSLEVVEREWRGLVIGNDGENFSAGANLLLILNEIDDDNLDDVEWIVRRFQDVNQRLRFSRCPVVVATHGLTLGGGCEVALGADRVCAAAETYIGLVELGAGVIPAGGGCKELVKRAEESLPADLEADLFPLIRRIFETVGVAKVATSAPEARELGFLRPNDVVVINRDHLLHDAKNTVLGMSLSGYTPPRPRTDIRVLGEAGLAAIRAGLHNLRASGFISEYDQLLGDRLAWVLCGGEVARNSRVSEQYLLDLERQAFLELCENPKTQERMESILRTGKPLRN